MLHLAKLVVTPDFLVTTPRGLLLIYDERAGSTHLGWITEARLEDGVMSIKMAPAVIQKHGNNEWIKLEEHAFSAALSDSRVAFEDCGGYHCSDSGLTYPTFRIYPESTIPPEYVRDHDTLIQYGKVIR
jgi:hypothetical protein